MFLAGLVAKLRATLATFTHRMSWSYKPVYAMGLYIYPYGSIVYAMGLYIYPYGSIVYAMGLYIYPYGSIVYPWFYIYISFGSIVYAMVLYIYILW